MFIKFEDVDEQKPKEPVRKLGMTASSGDLHGRSQAEQLSSFLSPMTGGPSKVPQPLFQNNILYISEGEQSSNFQTAEKRGDKSINSHTFRGACDHQPSHAGPGDKPLGRQPIKMVSQDEFTEATQRHPTDHDSQGSVDDELARTLQRGADKT